MMLKSGSNGSAQSDHFLTMSSYPMKSSNHCGISALLVVTTLLSGVSLAATNREAGARIEKVPAPNIIIIVADDMGWGGHGL